MSTDTDQLRERAERAESALERVREVHAPVDAVHYAGRTQRLTQVCAGCGTDDGNWQVWPCPTVRAIPEDLRAVLAGEGEQS